MKKIKTPARKPYKTKGISGNRKPTSKAPATKPATKKKVLKVKHPYSNQYSESGKGKMVQVLQRPYTNQHGSRT